jgi:hypothetical protein
MLGGEGGPACSRTAPTHLQKLPLEYAAELAPELAPDWHGGAVREARGRGRRSSEPSPVGRRRAGWQRKVGCLCSVVPPIINDNLRHHSQALTLNGDIGQVRCQTVDAGRNLVGAARLFSVHEVVRMLDAGDAFEIWAIIGGQRAQVGIVTATDAAGRDLFKASPWAQPLMDLTPF